MRRTRLVPIFPVLILLSFACAPPDSGSIERVDTPASSTNEGIAAGVSAFLDDYMAAFQRGDAAAVASFYAEDAINAQPTGQVVVGREAIENLYAEVFQQLSPQITAYDPEYHVIDDWVFATERWTVLLSPAAADTMRVRGSGVWVAHREGDEWKVVLNKATFDKAME